MTKTNHQGIHDHHGHDHVETFNSAFLIAIIANSFFVILQVIFAYLSNSTSLLADAFHNLGDVLSLIVAWMATGLMRKKPTERATYGMKKTSILAALTNGILLVFTCGIIASDALYKLFNPSEIHALSVMLVAGVGIIVNGSTAVLFIRGAEDLNIRGAFLHLLYDALISFGVVISAGLIYWTGWSWVDPLVGLVIALIILKGTWFLFVDSFRLIIDWVPKGISGLDVRAFFLAQPGVQGIHDLHIWAMSTKENALSVHLVMPDEELLDENRAELVEQLHVKFGIKHVTIQVEKNPAHCEDSCHTPYP